MGDSEANAVMEMGDNSQVNAVVQVKDDAMTEDVANANAATKTDVESNEGHINESSEELYDGLINVKVCKEFDEVPYIGEITGVRKTAKGPLYKVIYRDGDKEEFSTSEAHEAKEKYVTLQSSMWDCMIHLVEDLDVNKLKEAGITTISDLELFGGGAVKPTNSGTPFDSLDMPLKTKQQLYITATYLLNDQILTKDSKMDEMARFNLSKTHGFQQEPPKTSVSPRKKSVIKAVATVKKSDKPMPRTRTTHAARKAAEAAEEISAAAPKRRGRPKGRGRAGPTTSLDKVSASES
jgi:hypothetical protein